MKLSEFESRVLKKKAELAYLLEDFMAAMKPIEPAVVLAKAAKVETEHLLSRGRGQVLIACRLESTHDQI